MSLEMTILECSENDFSHSVNFTSISATKYLKFVSSSDMTSQDRGKRELQLHVVGNMSSLAITTEDGLPYLAGVRPDGSEVEETALLRDT